MKETSNELQILTAGWSRGEQLLLKSLGAIGFALLTVLSAHVRIPLPFTPVPMTLQSFVAPLAGGFLGAGFGAASMLLYLILGLAGLNVFAAASGGLDFLVAPTFGYLIGFVIAATLVGWARDACKNALLLLGALILSHLAILVCGVAGLMLNANLSLQDALLKGVYPFLVGDVLKIALSYPVLFSYNKLRQN